MKILYLHQYFRTPKMHGGTRSYEMARRLVEAGHEVHLITTWQDVTHHKTWWHENIDGINVHWCPVPYSNKMGILVRIFAFFRFALKAIGKATSVGGDVVFSTSTPLTIAIPGVFAARRLKCRHVFEVRDLWPELPIAIRALRNPVVIWAARALERFAYRNSDRIIALSPGMADGVAKAGYPAGHITVIPNSCDLELFDPNTATFGTQLRDRIGLKEGQPMILYAGTFGAINGVSYLADLAAELHEALPDARFIAVGGGAEYDKVKDYARVLGVLDHNFLVFPSMSKLDLVEMFHAASVSTSLFIDLPEMWHNSANKFFDTLASGTAVAINYQGWQAKLVNNHDVGVVLDPDPKVGAMQLRPLLENRARMDKCGQNARTLAVVAFNRDVLAERLLKVLEEAVALDNHHPDKAKESQP